MSNAFPGLPTEQFTLSGTRWGGVIGFGAEYALTNNISIKSETLYLATFAAARGESVSAAGMSHIELFGPCLDS
jgi:hypothetical protein